MTLFWRRTRYLQWSIVFVVVFAVGFALGSQHTVSHAQSAISIPPEAEEAFEPMWQVFRMIRSSYIQPVEISTLVDGAISGMVDSLGDRFSGYMTPDVYQVLDDDFDGVVEGIGATVRTNEDEEVVIVSVIAGSPAMKAGIQPGDVFVEVNGESVAEMSQLELVTKVRGPSGSPVELTMRRGEELVTFTVIRERIEVPNIEYEVLESNIGYIKLYEFNAEARHQIDTALSALDASSLDGLVLDLRGNPGGLLSSVIDVASAFVKEGVILIEEFGDGREQVFNATGDYVDLDVPLVLLVDEGSASASELLAGALQDLDLAHIVGERTFGKGTVQTWASLVNGGGVRLTVARWLTPNRTWINEQGVMPDIIVEWSPDILEGGPDLQLDAALEYLTSQVKTP